MFERKKNAVDETMTNYIMCLTDRASVKESITDMLETLRVLYHAVDISVVYSSDRELIVSTGDDDVKKNISIVAASIKNITVTTKYLLKNEKSVIGREGVNCLSVVSISDGTERNNLRYSVLIEQEEIYEPEVEMRDFFVLLGFALRFYELDNKMSKYLLNDEHTGLANRDALIRDLEGNNVSVCTLKLMSVNNEEVNQLSDAFIGTKMKECADFLRTSGKKCYRVGDMSFAIVYEGDTFDGCMYLQNIIDGLYEKKYGIFGGAVFSSEMGVSKAMYLLENKYPYEQMQVMYIPDVICDEETESVLNSKKDFRMYQDKIIEGSYRVVKSEEA